MKTALILVFTDTLVGVAVASFVVPPMLFDCIKAFSETDFTEDLEKFDVPTLILHGDDDQVVPIGASALASAKLVKNAALKVYSGAPDGITDTHKDQLNADLLVFCQAAAQHEKGQIA